MVLNVFVKTARNSTTFEITEISIKFCNLQEFRVFSQNIDSFTYLIIKIFST